MWTAKLTSFRKARSLIESVLKGSRQVPDFAKVVQKAEAGVKEFKTDHQRYKVLWRSYERKLANKSGPNTTATEGDDDAVEE